MDWRVRVRVTRMWPSVGNNDNFLGFNLILLDAENYHVHAFAQPAVWNSFGHMITEGNAYDFERFVTREPVGRLRPVTSDRAIVLTNATIVHPVPLEVITIPRHKFEVVNLSELYNLAMSYLTEQTPLYAIDVVGEVRNIEPVEHINTNSGTRSCARFQLYDGRMSVKVIVWDDLLESIAPLYQGNIDTPTIVLLTSVYGRAFKSCVEVSTTRNSRVLINLHYEAVLQMRQRILDQQNEVLQVSP